MVVSSGIGGRLRHVRTAVAAMASVAGVSGSCLAAPPQSDIDRLQGELDALRAQMQMLAAQPLPAAAQDRTPVPHTDDDSLTFHGITLYGVVDLGVSYQSRGTTYNGDYNTGVEELVSKNSKSAVWSLTPNGMSTSTIGLKGKERLLDDVDGVFTLEMGFNPVSGVLSNGPKSVIDNNNTLLTEQSSYGDSSRGGQPFNGQANAGLSSDRYGTLTFGRHGTPLFDDVVAYDPFGGSNGFSLVGYAGATAGGGDTEDARLDDSIKYSWSHGPFRMKALYQLPGNISAAGGDDAYYLGLGWDRGGLSVDAVYAHKNDAIALSPLDSRTATSATSASAQAAAYSANPQGLGATVSDNTAFGVMAKYRLRPAVFYAGYERITYMNPNKPFTAGTAGEGGYVIALLSTSNYTTAKQFHVIWTGVDYALTEKLKLTGAYYRYIQENYSGVDNGVCMAAGMSSCYGVMQVGSVGGDYTLSKHFDLYAGVAYSRVDAGYYNGNGYLHNNTVSPMAGGRFRF